MSKSREQALKSLREWIWEAKVLIVCDYNFLWFYDGDFKANFSEFYNTLPKSIKKIVLVHSTLNANDIFYQMERDFASVKVQFFSFYCPHIHDRVWIVNNSMAFANGITFGNQGYSLSYKYRLNRSDFKNFWHFLVTQLGDDFKNAVFLS